MNKFISSWVVALGLMSAATATFAQAGRLDPTFGNSGIVHTNFGTGNTFNSSGAALAPNGDIVVSGDIRSTSEVAVVVRYVPSGTLDSTFGGGGIVKMPPPSTFVFGSSFTTGVTVQPDGKPLVLFGAFDQSGANSEFVLRRLNVNGQIDTTFGAGGQSSLSFLVPQGYTAASINVAVVQSDGKILAGGVVSPPFRSNLPLLTLLARFLPNGSLDSSFGGGGVTEVAAIGDPSSLAFSGTNILAGNNLGQIAEFGSTGNLLQTSPQRALVVNEAQPTIFLADGEFLAAANVGSPQLFKNSQDAVVRRYNLSGQDTTFQSRLIRLAPDAPQAQNLPMGIHVDGSGRIALGVQRQTQTGQTGGVARLNPDGSLDTSFGTNGIGTVVSALGVNTILVQPNNDIITIGGGTLARYLGQ